MKRLIGLLCVLVLGLANPVWAAVTCAAPGQGENTSMPASTDGAFSVTGGGATVTDSRTDLEWDRCTLGQAWDATNCTGTPGLKTWQEALQAAVAANSASYLGHQDWRLPNLKELKSLVEQRCWAPAIDTHYFPDTETYYYRSGTPYVRFSSAVSTVNFYNGTDIAFGAGDFLIGRLVRGGQSLGTFDLFATSTAVTSSVNPSTLGQSVTFTATVTGAGGTPTGTVNFKDGGTSISGCASQALSSGVATCVTSALSLGTHPITADYSGDSNFATSTGTLSGGQGVRTTSVTGNNPGGSGQTTVTLSNASAACGFASAQFSAASGAPSGWVFPYGLFAFHADGCAPGSTLTLVFTFPGAVPAGTAFGKFGPTQDQPATPHWYQLPASISGNQLTVTLTDGGAGDSDLAVNGQFTDPGGAVIAANAAAIPTLAEWSMVLMVTLLGGLGWRAKRQSAALGR